MTSGFQPGVRLPFSLGSRELLIKIFKLSSAFYIQPMEQLFVVAKIIESPGKNDCLLFHSKLF